MRRIGIVVVPVLVIAGVFLVACGGSANPSSGADPGSNPSAASVSTSSASVGSSGAATVGSIKLSDCQYAAKFTDSLQVFTTNMQKVGGTSVASGADADSAFAAMDAEVAKLIADLRSYKLSGDVQKLNDAMVGIFTDFQKTLPDLKSAAMAGDAAKVAQVGTKFQTELGPRFEKLAKENKGAADKLDTCGT